MEKSKKDRKILYFITKGNWGGAQKYVFELAVKAKQEGLDPSVAIGNFGTELQSKLKEQGVRTIKLKYLSNSLNPIRLFFSIIENIRLINKEKPEIVHTNSSFAGISIGTACSILSQKNVFTCHGWAFNEDRNFIVKQIIKIAFSFMILFHDKTICVSETLKKQTPKLFGIFDLKYKCYVIHNGVNELDIKYIDFSNYKILDKSVVNIVTIGELHNSKNYPLVLSALEKLPENLKWNYHIIGDGQEKADIKKIISNHKYKDRIFMYGPILDAANYLKNFDVFALGSITESFAYVLVEAGYAHLPCVATQVGGIPEVIDNEVNGLLSPTKNAEKLSENLQMLITDKNLRTTLGDNLYKKVKTNFTKNKMLRKTFEIYNSI